MRQRFDDRLSTVFFLVAYLVSGDIFVATGIALAAGVAQMSYVKLRGPASTRCDGRASRSSSCSAAQRS